MGEIKATMVEQFKRLNEAMSLLSIIPSYSSRSARQAAMMPSVSKALLLSTVWTLCEKGLLAAMQSVLKAWKAKVRSSEKQREREVEDWAENASLVWLSMSNLSSSVDDEIGKTWLVMR